MPSTSRSIRLGVAAMIAVLAAASVPALTSAAPVDKWGWAVVRKPAASWSEVKGKDGGSISGGRITVKRLARGYHRVRFKGVSSTTTGVQVTPLSDSGAMCTYYGAGTPSGPTDVYVNCRNRLGQARDTKFMVSWVESALTHSGPRMAYFWANQPTTASYAPYYQFMSNADQAWVSRPMKGWYIVRLWHLSGVGGNVQVTTFGTKAVACAVASWSTTKDGVNANVRCRDRKGIATDSKFNFMYTADEGLKGSGGNSWAYLYANQPTAKGYAATSSYYRASPAGNAWIKRLDKGRYAVKLKSMPLGGAVQVTAVDDWKRCHVSNVRKSGLPQRIAVRCFKANGSKLADARFVLSYVK